jgi:hypothetical protein
MSQHKRNALVSWFQKFMNFSIKFPRTVVLIYFLALLIIISSFTSVKLELDIYDVKNEFFNSSKNWFLLRDEFKDPNSLYLIWKPSENLNASRHCAWQNEVNRTKNNNQKITRIFQAYTARVPRIIAEDLLYQKILPDPCLLASGESFKLDNLEELRNSYLGPILIDKNYSKFITEISFEGDLENNEIVKIGEIEEVARHLLQKNKEIDPNGSIHYFGPLSYRLEFKKILQNDSYLNLCILLFFILFFRLVLGTWSSGFVYSLTIVGTLAYTFGLLFIFGFPIDILTNNLVLMTAIAGTADFLFLSFAQFRTSEKQSYFDLVTPSFFTTFTTMVGFISLYSSDLVLIKRFGVEAAIAAFFEWLIIFSLLPALRSLFGLNTGWVNKSRSLKMIFLGPMLKKKMPQSCVIGIMAFSMLSLFSWKYLNYSDSPKNNFPKNHELRKTIEEFTKDFGWEGSFSLLFSPHVTKKEIEFIHQRLKENKLVYYIESKNELLSSWTKDIISKPRRDLILRDFESSKMNSRFESDSHLRSVVYLKNINTYQLEAFESEVNSLCGKKCFMAGQSLVYLELNKRVSATMIESFGTSIILVLSILFLVMQYLKIRGVRFYSIAVSSLIGPMFMMTFIAFLQIPINVVTSIFFAALVGMTGDNAIQYLFASEGGELQDGLKTRGEASFVFSVLLILGSLFFIGQTLVPLKWLGFLFSIGFAINFVGDYWILKSFERQ